MSARGVASISCSFSTPGEPVAVQVEVGVLNRLRQQVLAGKALGREASGLLLGRVDAARHSGVSQPILGVESFIALPPDGSHLNADALLPKESLRKVQLHEGETRAVGFYRAYFRGLQGPTNDDVNFMLSYFGDGNRVLLLIDGSGKRISATFYRVAAGDQSGICASYPISLDWPPDERSLDRPAALSQPDHELPDAAPESARAHAGPQHGRSSTRIALVLAGVAILTMGGLGYRFLMLLDQQRREMPKVSDALELKTERSGENQWRLSWNRSASAIRKAGRGHLAIIDGYLHKELEVTADDLQTSAGIIYSSVADDLTFRLEVFDVQAGRAVSESIRVLARPTPHWAAATRYGREPATWAARKSLGTETDNSSESPGAAGRAGNRSVQSAERAQARSGQPLRTFTPPLRPEVPVVVSRAVNDLPVPPAFESGTGSAEQSTPSLAEPLAAAISPPPPPQAARRVEGGSGNPVQVSPVAGASVSAGEQSSHSGVEAPILLHRTDPQYPKLAAEKRITGTVRVQATVGTDGRLHDPTVLSGPPLLRVATLDAIQHWTYTPARVNRQVVPAPTTIEIRFGTR